MTDVNPPHPSPYEGDTVKVRWIYGGPRPYRYRWCIVIEINLAWEASAYEEFDIAEAEEIRDELNAAIDALRSVTEDR